MQEQNTISAGVNVNVTNETFLKAIATSAIIFLIFFVLKKRAS